MNSLLQFPIIRLLLYIKIISLLNFFIFLKHIRIIFDIVFQSYLHIFHFTIQIACLSILIFLFIKKISVYDKFFFIRFWLYFYSEYWKFYNSFQKHISLFIYFDLKLLRSYLILWLVIKFLLLFICNISHILLFFLFGCLFLWRLNI